MLTLLALVLAAPGPVYDLDDPPTTSVRALDDAKLGTQLDGHLKQKGLTAKNTATGATGTAGLSREVKLALLMALNMTPLSENDLMVEGAGGFTPVEVLWDATTLAYTVGAPRAKLYGAGPTAAELQKKYGVGDFVDDGAAWDSDMLFVVEQVLAKLTPAELALLAGMPFHRIPKPAVPAAKGTLLALYRQDTTLPRARIELYDAARAGDKLRFTGSVDAFVPQSAAMLMHEVGHAVSRAGSQRKFDEVKAARKQLDEAATAFNEGQQKYNADRAEYMKSKDPALGKSLQERGKSAKDEAAKVKALQATWTTLQASALASTQQSPTEAAFLAKLPQASAPTPYGRSLGAEAFAESYRIWKFDRAALERAAPGIAAWFESDAFAGTLAP